MKKYFNKEQLAQLEKIKTRFYGMAVSTKPANRPEAERTAAALAKIAGVKVSTFQWVNNPVEGVAAYTATIKHDDKKHDSVSSNIDETLSFSHGSNLHDSFSSSCGNSVEECEAAEYFWDVHQGSFGCYLPEIPTPGYICMGGGLIPGCTENALGTWEDLAICAASRNMFGVRFIPQTKRILRLYEELWSACTAYYVTPSVIILLERPLNMEFKGEQPTNITWRT